MSQPNTKIEYQYTDAGGWHAYGSAVLAGRVTAKEREIIESKLDEGEHFIPSQVGLDDLQGELQEMDTKDWDDDHVWHTIDEITLTDEVVTTQLTWTQLMNAFRTVEWNVADDTLPSYNHPKADGRSMEL